MRTYYVVNLQKDGTKSEQALKLSAGKVSWHTNSSFNRYSVFPFFWLLKCMEPYLPGYISVRTVFLYVDCAKH